jgi:hypothetical protein
MHSVYEQLTAADPHEAPLLVLALDSAQNHLLKAGALLDQHGFAQSAQIAQISGELMQCMRWLNSIRDSVEAVASYTKA